MLGGRKLIRVTGLADGGLKGPRVADSVECVPVVPVVMGDDVDDQPGVRAGAHDVVCPPADAEAVAAAVPNGRAAVVEDAAHLAPAEDPRETSRLLLEFFGALVK